MWLLLALLSAALLGFYDVFKKQSLTDNAVIPVLFLSILFSSMLFLPLMIVSALRPETLQGTAFFVPGADWNSLRYVMLKSCIVLGSWLCGYFGMKHLPLTIVGPINAARPVMVLVGALLIFGERLNLYQWIGVLLAMLSFFMLSKSGKNENIDFRRDKWIFLLVMASVLGALSGLYDKHLLAPVNAGGLGLDRMVVQSWFTLFQLLMMGVVLVILWYPKRKTNTPFHWEWSIIGISVFLSAADFAYFYALSLDGSMIAIISMIRRSSVMVSFIFGALIFHEKNLKSKSFDLLLVLAGMVFLYLGSK